MADLAPTLNNNIGYEQPVQSPSLLSGVADLTSGFASLLSQPKGKVSQTDIIASDKQAFYGDLQRGTALIEQGKPGEGRRLITKAYRQFAGKYGREYDDVNTAFQDATGFSFDVETTASPVDIEQISQSPEFNIAAAIIQQQNPEASPDQVFELALEKETNRLATDMRINEIEQQEKVNWYDAEEAYVAKARQAGDTIRGMLATAEQDQVITPDEARNLRQFYNTMYGTITKPRGVDQDKWDQYQEEYIQPLTAIVNGAIGIGEGAGLSQDMSRALSGIVSKAVAQGKLPASLMVKMQGDSVNSYDSFIQLLEQSSKDPKYTENYNFVSQASFDEMLDWVTEFEFKTDLDQLKLDTTEFDTLEPSKKRESLINGASLLSLGAGPEQIAVDLVQTNAKMKAIGTKALLPEDFGSVYNAGYFAGVQRVFQANPVIGRKVAQDAVDSINSQKIAISRSLQSEAEQLGLMIQGGIVVPNPELMPSSVQAAVDSFFGGSWDRAFAAEGVDGNGRTHASIKAITDQAKRSLLPKVNKFTQASNAVDQLSEQFLTPEVTGDSKDMGKTNRAPTVSNVPETATGLIASFEGFREGAYWDVDAFRTGYGSDTVTLRDGSVVQVTKDTVVTREDAERDLARRTEEFARTAKRQVGSEVWTNLPKNVTNALTSIAYNYGDLPDRIVPAVKSGDIEAIAVAIEGLAGDNDGINRNRRMKEAAIVRGKQLPPTAAPEYSRPPKARPTDTENITVAQAPSSGGGTVAPQAPAQAATEPTQGARASEDTGKGVRSPQATQAVWNQLSDQTKKMLIRLFGDEESVIAAIESNEISEEDIL